MVARNTTQRDRHRAIVKRGEPDCGICNEPIDYALPYLDPLSYVVDHIKPLARGGLDVIENKQAAHRKCNRAKGDKLPEDIGPRRFLTTRRW
jgi:5-methylcytosine-specific restriction endonuclease McrA